MEEKIKIELENWILNTLKNTSSMQTESILPEMIKAYVLLSVYCSSSLVCASPEVSES